MWILLCIQIGIDLKGPCVFDIEKRYDYCFLYVTSIRGVNGDTHMMQVYLKSTFFSILTVAEHDNYLGCNMYK